jgi:hypothetical protein
MRIRPSVSHIQFRPASELDRSGGLLGWVCFEFRGLRFDGARIHRTRNGEIKFIWPEHVAGTGRRHVIVQPLDEETHAAIEQQVIAELRRRRCIP